MEAEPPPYCSRCLRLAGRCQSIDVVAADAQARPEGATRAPRRNHWGMTRRQHPRR